MVMVESDLQLTSRTIDQEFMSDKWRCMPFSSLISPSLPGYYEFRIVLKFMWGACDIIKSQTKIKNTYLYRNPSLRAYFPWLILSNHFHKSNDGLSSVTWVNKANLALCNKSFLNENSTKKRASRASALRADETQYTRGLVSTPWTSPTPWTRPKWVPCRS